MLADMGDEKRPSKSEQLAALPRRPFYRDVSESPPDPGALLGPTAKVEEKPKRQPNLTYFSKPLVSEPPPREVLDELRKAVEAVERAERPVKAERGKRPSGKASGGRGRPKSGRSKPWEERGMKEWTYYRLKKAGKLPKENGDGDG